MSEINFAFDLKQKVKNVETGKEGVVDTCGLDHHGQIFYVVFPEKHVPNHWFRPERLKAVD